LKGSSTALSSYTLLRHQLQAGENRGLGGKASAIQLPPCSEPVASDLGVELDRLHPRR
jgi:hypothetical protein